MNRRLRIAYFSPLPPAASGIADYSRELLPPLAALADVTLFAERPEDVAEPLASAFAIQPFAAYPRLRWNFDIALYQMGNNRLHAEMYEVLRRYPGIIVLHDSGLHHFVAGQLFDSRGFGSYVREMGYELGAPGLQQAREVRRGQRALPFLDVPLNDRLVHLSLGALVHSNFVRQQLLAKTPACPVGVVPAPIREYAVASKRLALDWPDDAVIFGSFGQVTPAKQIARALQAFVAVRNVSPQARFLIVGDCADGEVALPELIDRLGVREFVQCVGHIPDLVDFAGWVAAADVVVNLRAPTVGETSATALRALAAGRPLIVYDHGWYAELPDDVCLKVAPLDDDALRAAMVRLAADANLRCAMGSCGRAYALQVHAPERAAHAYNDFIGGVLDDLRPQLSLALP